MTMTTTQSTTTRRVGPLVAGVVLLLLALACFASGAWVLWKDRVDRDADGLVSLGTTELRTDAYAIVGDLRGDGPSWLYGSAVIGDERVRATSSSDQQLFIGIGPEADVDRYLSGVGYATISGFEVSPDTTHVGGPPSNPPARETMWATSTQGTGEQTLLWTPRDGDWSVVFMNADASEGVSVQGDASAELPVLPWIAGVLLFLALVGGAAGGWLALGVSRRQEPPGSPHQDAAASPDVRMPVGASS